MTTLRAPFPWFGGKSRVSHLVWDAFGDVANYVEPFAGSLAVLLGRPGDPRIETVNDLDCYLANFWRAVQHAPELVAEHADWPVNEADLHARHRWLVDRAEFRERIRADPDFFDAQIAGWWVWGLCQWIGGGWCASSNWGEGSLGYPSDERKRPVLGRGGRRGVNATALSRQMPCLSGDSGASGRGIHASGKSLNGIVAWMHRLSDRLRHVRVCCGDWQRILGPAVTTCIGNTGVFLDPPYADTADRDPSLYSCDDLDVAHRVREWAIAHGDDPKLRIALCGYEGEHQMPESWACAAWKTSGGYGSRNPENKNAARERIWFSPHCLGARQRDLFAAVSHG